MILLASALLAIEPLEAIGSSSVLDRLKNACPGARSVSFVRTNQEFMCRFYNMCSDRSPNSKEIKTQAQAIVDILKEYDSKLSADEAFKSAQMENKNIRAKAEALARSMNEENGSFKGSDFIQLSKERDEIFALLNHPSILGFQQNDLDTLTKLHQGGNLNDPKQKAEFEKLKKQKTELDQNPELIQKLKNANNQYIQSMLKIIGSTSQGKKVLDCVNQPNQKLKKILGKNKINFSVMAVEQVIGKKSLDPNFAGVFRDNVTQYEPLQAEPDLLIDINMDPLRGTLGFAHELQHACDSEHRCYSPQLEMRKKVKKALEEHSSQERQKLSAAEQKSLNKGLDALLGSTDPVLRARIDRITQSNLGLSNGSLDQRRSSLFYNLSQGLIVEGYLEKIGYPKSFGALDDTDQKILKEFLSHLPEDQRLGIFKSAAQLQDKLSKYAIKPYPEDVPEKRNAIYQSILNEIEAHESEEELFIQLAEKDPSLCDRKISSGRFGGSAVHSIADYYYSIRESGVEYSIVYDYVLKNGDVYPVTAFYNVQPSVSPNQFRRSPREFVLAENDTQLKKRYGPYQFSPDFRSFLNSHGR